MTDLSVIEADSSVVLGAGDAARPFAWRRGQLVTLQQFRSDTAAIAASLPRDGAMINLCEDRYTFVAAYTAAVARGQSVLLPPSRAERVVAEVEGANPGSYRVDDEFVERAWREGARSTDVTQAAADAIAMVAYTSGSTGVPQANAKRWLGLCASSARNAHAMRAVLGTHRTPWLVATVPPQHMYGMELSVLLPLLEGMALHAGRPLFPADIARALEEVPLPRVLVSTPVHMRAIVDSPQAFPEVSLVVSATAPLDRALAQAVEAKLGAPVLEMFGSTETCVFASRLTARQDRWRLYEGVSLEPLENATRVEASWFMHPVFLQDVVERFGDDEFVVRGRNADMVEVAGKRASLADLTRRLLAVEGVRDAIVFQPEPPQAGVVARVAALVVAPGLTPRQILDRLGSSVDPAFLPRPLAIVDALPRNDVGKLPREKLLATLALAVKR
jgi:acyl-coenzyme A synthetase/AMP-(fatty) acid ligase